MRKPDWRSRFANFMHSLIVLNNAGEVTFDWNPHSLRPHTYNCLTFSSKVVEMLTGKDIYANMAEMSVYSTPIEAYRVLREIGYNSLDQLLGSLFQEVRATHAIMGDLLLIPAKEAIPGDHKSEGLNYAVAVCDPPYFWTISSEYGLARGNIYQLLRQTQGGLKAYHVD